MDPCRVPIVLHPSLDWTTSPELQVCEPPIAVIMEPSRAGLERAEAVDVDADMVVVDVPKLSVLDSVKLNCKDVVA